MACEHMNFLVNARVGRLTDREGGHITGYTTDITVKCTDCGLPFRWLGLPFGVHQTEPRLSVDSQELRAPIEPAYTAEILGQPLKSGRA